MKYELLIFDLDGTLIDTRKDIANSANAMLEHYGLKPKTVSELTSYVGDGIAAFVERCIGDTDLDFEEAVTLFKGFYTDKLLENTRPYDGVMVLLDRLHMHRRVILTNKAFVPSKTIVNGLGLAPYFELLVGGDTLPRKKPFPDGVEYILETTGVDRDRTLLIGDGRNDIITAGKAGVQSVYVSWGFSDNGSVSDLNPDFRIDTPEELLNIL